MAKKKGVCHNYDDCELAEIRAVQEVDEFEFRCTECGKELTLVDGDEGDPNKKKRLKKIAIASCAAVAVGAAGAGIWLALPGDEEPVLEPAVEHNTRVAAVNVDANWAVDNAPLDSLKDGDTIWVKANENIDKAVQEAGVQPEVVLDDSTSVAVVTPEVVTDVANIQVKTADGQQSATYVLALVKKPFEKEDPDSVRVEDPQPNPQPNPQPVSQPNPRPNGALYRVSYATFDGRTLQFKVAHVIPGTSRVAQPGDEVTGEWKDNEVNFVRWYHADGTPSEPLNHD